MFSPRDVAALKETGARIKETYSVNLFKEANGPGNVLDDDALSYELITKEGQEIRISTPEQVTINRFVIQEAIATHGERIEQFVLEALINNEWQQIATGTNVGYKRILRFGEVTSDQFRLRVLAFRQMPAIANISAHYYASRPPQLDIQRSVEGQVTIAVKKHTFRWKPHGEDVAGNLYRNMDIRYTTDGSEPTASSKAYEAPFFLSGGEVKARAYLKNQAGSVASNLFGMVKKDWQVLNYSSELMRHSADAAFDGDNSTFWQSKPAKTGKHYLSIDLGDSYNLRGFIYTPQTNHSKGMIQKGVIKVSADGKKWKTLEEFTFGNLINDPTSRKHLFNKAAKGRYVRIESIEIAGDGQIASMAEIDFLL